MLCKFSQLLHLVSVKCYLIVLSRYKRDRKLASFKVWNLQSWLREMRQTIKLSLRIVQSTLGTAILTGWMQTSVPRITAAVQSVSPSTAPTARAQCHVPSHVTLSVPHSCLAASALSAQAPANFTGHQPRLHRIATSQHHPPAIAPLVFHRPQPQRREIHQNNHIAHVS